MRPRAKKFLARSPWREPIPRSLIASRFSDCDRDLDQAGSARGILWAAGRARSPRAAVDFLLKASLFTITMPPRRTSSMFARSAAGLNATSTSGWSAGVRTSLGREVDLEARDAGERTGGCADLGGKVGQGGEIVSGERSRLGELGSGELDSATGVAAKTNGNTFDLLGGFPHRFADHLGWGAGWATRSPASGGVHVRSGSPGFALGTDWMYRASASLRNPTAAGPSCGPVTRGERPLPPLHFPSCLRAPIVSRLRIARPDTPGMIVPAAGPLTSAPEGLHALYVSLNSPVITLDPLPVGPAAAAIAVHGTGTTLLIRSVRTGTVAYFHADPRAGLEAALSHAEGLGFLFDDESNLAGFGALRSEWPGWLSEIFSAELDGEEPGDELDDSGDSDWLSKFRWVRDAERSRH